MIMRDANENIEHDEREKEVEQGENCKEKKEEEKQGTKFKGR